MIEVKKTIDKFLGMKVKDKVTTQTGVVTSISFDLYGCVQCLVTPSVTQENKRLDSMWYDNTRLEMESKKPVMDLPEFGYSKGPAKKPTL